MRGQDTVSVLKGVGEQREKRLHRLGIVTVEDLLTHYPREYKDRSEILKIADLPQDEPATFLAQIKEEGQNSRHGRLVYTRMKVYDETGAVGVLWYNQPYMKSSLKIGEWYLFSGRLQKKYGRTEVVSPECERIGENFAGGRILPVYPSVEGLSQKMLRNLMEEALKEMSGGMQEELPLWLRKEYHLAERNFAIENIHFPKTEQGFYDARKRLVFEELFLLQTALYQLKSTLEERGEGIRLKKKKALQDGETLLPFALTDAQKRVLAEIVQDMTSGSESRSAQPQPPFLHYYPPASLPHPCQTASQSGLMPHPVPFAYLQILHLPFVPLPPFYFHLSKPYRILFIFTNICSLFFHFIRFCSPCQRLFSLLHRLFRQSHCRKNHRTPQISPEVHPFAV